MKISREALAEWYLLAYLLLMLKSVLPGRHKILSFGVQDQLLIVSSAKWFILLSGSAEEENCREKEQFFRGQEASRWQTWFLHSLLCRCHRGCLELKSF